ncbi:MAG: TonB-dependent receptor [Desulfobacteraceae bacterium]|jgi:iron complex outermembrane receptor protein
MKPCICLCIALVVLAVPGVSHSEEKKEAKDTTVTLEEVVVTGTRTEQKVERIPAHVTVIDEQDIRNSNAKNVPDLLRSEGGVVVRDLLGNGKRSQVDLRGFGEAGPLNSLILVDGRRVNAIDLSGVDWTQIPLDQIERIEIVRGTGSVLYGDNAAGGVINIITKTPSEELTLTAGGAFGSYSRSRGRIYVSGGKENVAASAFASYDSTAGYRENNEFRTKDAGGKILYDPTDFLSFNLSGSYHADEYGLPGTLTEAELATDRRATNDPLDDAETWDKYLNLGSNLDLGNYGSLVIDFSYRDRSSKAIFPDPTGVFPQRNENEADTRGLTPRYVWDGEILNHANTLIAGVDLYWADQEINSFGGFFIPLETLTGTSNIERNSYGIYFSDEFSLLENLFLSVGARRERVSYDFSVRDLTPVFPLAPLDHCTTERKNAYSIGITYLYSGRSSVYARANRSFRFPLTDEVVIYDFSAGKIRANTEIKPQRGRHYELGLRHHFSSNIRASINLYRAEIKDEIFYNPSPVFLNENHPETLHRGVEIGSRGDFFKKLTVYGNYTYQKATFEKDPFKGNEIPAVPRHKANLGFRIHDIVPGLLFGADYNYVGSSFVISDQENDFKKLEHYYTIDLTLSYEWKMAKAFAGVNNITDQKYSDYAVMDTFLTKRNFYPAPETNWVAGLEIVF